MVRQMHRNPRLCQGTGIQQRRRYMNHLNRRHSPHDVHVNLHHTHWCRPRTLTLHLHRLQAHNHHTHATVNQRLKVHRCSRATPSPQCLRCLKRQTNQPCPEILRSQTDQPHTRTRKVSPRPPHQVSCSLSLVWILLTYCYWHRTIGRAGHIGSLGRTDQRK